MESDASAFIVSQLLAQKDEEVILKKNEDGARIWGKFILNSWMEINGNKVLVFYEHDSEIFAMELFGWQFYLIP